jgi:hypothetical protein
MIAAGVVAVLGILGGGWALEKIGHSHTPAGATSIEPAKMDESVPAGGQRPSTDTSPDYDRSDLLLSQG